MINKLTLQGIINKYHLGSNDTVSALWEIRNKFLLINFTTTSKDLIGRIAHRDFPLVDSDLAIFDTKKLLNLISICQNDILLEVEKRNVLSTLLKISDKDFTLFYPLSDPLLISKQGKVNTPVWDLEVKLETEYLFNLVKAQSALSDTEVLLIKSTLNSSQESVVEFILGNNSNYSNKIIYQLPSSKPINDFEMPFNSLLIKNVLNFNKDMEEGKLYISHKGLIKFEFEVGSTLSEYYIVRKENY